ncbi:hypothetical protein GKODMF_10375 [Candidatus Electrothrix gigas]
MGNEPFFHLGLFQTINLLVQLIQGLMFCQQFLSCLRANPRHSLDIIRRVSGKRKIIQELFRLEAVFFFHCSYIHEPIIHRLPENYILRNELQEILVPGNYYHLAFLFHQQPGCRGNQIISLQIIRRHAQQVIGVYNFMNIRNL